MSIQVFFSDFFGVSPETLEVYGSVDVSLLNDIPLFIDPFLLFNSETKEYQELHESIIEYVTFLRGKAEAGTIQPGLLKEWFCFPEVRQLWLGFCLSGNAGSGLGMDFARKLHRNLHTIFKDFGTEEITGGSHIEKLCLIEEDVGKDNISDFTANLIKGFLVEYTSGFAMEHLSDQEVAEHTVEGVRFNYSTESWVSETHVLPSFNGDYVLLAPRDMLRKDETWINKLDLVGQFESVRDAVDNDVLRARISNYFLQRIPPKKATRKEVREAAAATIRKYPEVIDYFIRYKEERGDEAVAVSEADVRFAERRFIESVREFTSLLHMHTGFFNVSGGTLEEARMRAEFLRDVIENKDGWRVFYVDGEPVLTEDHLHILFRLTWLGTPSDLSHEVDEGRGPADFKVSRGAFDKTIIEFKLARNRKLRQNLQHQVEAYKSASDAEHGLKVILFFTEAELQRVLGILDELGMADDTNVVLIDGRSDNKPSASNVA